MKVLAALQLVQLDDGVYKASILHPADSNAHLYFQNYETVEEACQDLARLFAQLPTTTWFQEMVDD